MPEAAKRSMPSSRERKKRFREALLISDFSTLVSEPQAFGTLVSLLYETDRLVQWRAIDALGQLAATRAKTNLESVREMMRRLFWAMNDESGGFIWMAPEAIAHILSKVPQLTCEYSDMLISHHHLPCFQTGIFRAANELASFNPQAMRPWIDVLKSGLLSENAEDRANAASALKLTDPSNNSELMEILIGDDSTFSYYDFASGQFIETEVREFVEY